MARQGRMNQRQRDELLLDLTRQVADLSQQLQRLQREQPGDGCVPGNNRPLQAEGPPVENFNKGSDLDIQSDGLQAEDVEINPFHASLGDEQNLPRRGHHDRNPRVPPAWENLDDREFEKGIKMEIAEFDGKKGPDLFLDWLRSIENFFGWKYLLEDCKVVFVKAKLRGTVAVWWDRMEESRDMVGNPMVRTWEQMKIKLKERFLPLDYKQNLFERYQNLRQKDMSVEEYTESINKLCLCNGLTEAEEVVTMRCLSGLKIQI